MKNNVFYLHEEHRQFPNNRDELVAKQKQSLKRAIFILVLMNVGCILMVAIQRCLKGIPVLSGGVPLLFSLLGGISFIIIILVIILQKRAIRLFSEGQVLNGTLKQIKGVEDKGNYIVKVKYNFPSSFGETKTGKNTIQCNDLRGKELPEAGTPIRVLYRTEKHFRML